LALLLFGGGGLWGALELLDAPGRGAPSTYSNPEPRLTAASGRELVSFRVEGMT
jgi:hypothetical protein